MQVDRLFETLKAAGLPIQYLTGSGQSDVGIVYSHDPTDETKAKVQALLDTFDWSQEAEEAWIKNKKKMEAIEAIDTHEVPVVLLRNSQKIVLLAFSGIISKLNELIVAHNGKTGDSLDSYPSPKSWDELVDTLKYLIERE